MAIYLILFFYWRVLFLFSDQKRLPVNNKKKNVRDTGSVSPGSIWRRADDTPSQKKKKKKIEIVKKICSFAGPGSFTAHSNKSLKKKIKEEDKRVGSLALWCNYYIQMGECHVAARHHDRWIDCKVIYESRSCPSFIHTHRKRNEVVEYTIRADKKLKRTNPSATLQSHFLF